MKYGRCMVTQILDSLSVIKNLTSSGQTAFSILSQRNCDCANIWKLL